nr:MAG TPA: hypothetical protein [Caudoviricetes sp.]
MIQKYTNYQVAFCAYSIISSYLYIYIDFLHFSWYNVYIKLDRR